MLVFLKLGGSLITDKSTPESAHIAVINRLAGEIRGALDVQPDLRLVVGHGSGSFGHVAANRYGTQRGVSTAEQWHGFAEVSVVAARLDTLVLEALYEARVPVFRAQPSASAICHAGKLLNMATAPIEQALAQGLVPLVYGDVAIDNVQGGTIISTEDVFAYLARELKPAHILLAGNYDGVMDQHGTIISRITPASLPGVQSALGGSKATDVTGGMAAKVESMLDLAQTVPGLHILIFNGEKPGAVQQALIDLDRFPQGTHLEDDEDAQ